MEHCDYKIRATVKKDFLDDVIQLFDIFRKQDVKVFARDGLLLGAMRHKGFLPFDVDPDVGILTENYSDLKNADLSDDYILNVGPTKRNVKYYFDYSFIKLIIFFFTTSLYIPIFISFYFIK